MELSVLTSLQSMLLKMADASYSAVPEEGNRPPTLTLPFLRELMAEIHRLPLDAAASPPQKIPWAMVAIRNHNDDDWSDSTPIIFPPINHENLQIYTEKPLVSHEFPHPHAESQRLSFSDSDSLSDSDSCSSSTFSPSYSSPSPPSPSPVFSDLASTPEANSPGWLKSWMEILCTRVNGLVRIIRSRRLFTFSRGGFLCFRSAAFTAVLLAFLYFRWRRSEESKFRWWMR